MLPFLPRYMLWLVAASIAVRLLGLSASLSLAGPGPLVYGDATSYVALADNLSHGKGFSQDVQGKTMTEKFRTPGLPFILAPFTLLPNGMVVYAIFLSLVAGALLPILTYALGRILVGESAALIAATLTAFEPQLITFSWMPMTEMPFLLIMLGGFLLALLGWKKGKTAHVFGGGLLLGYAVLIRPPFLYVFFAAIFVATLWQVTKKRRHALRNAAVLLSGLVLLISPWLVRNYAVTGVPALAGTGWRNVYTDYLASARSLDNKTSFSSENIRLESQALREGIDVNDPASGHILRDRAIPELWQRRSTVLHLESYLLVSFFMQDGYFYVLKNFGFIRAEGGEAYSASFALLTKGSDGFRAVLSEMKRQYYIPLFGRVFTVGVSLLALFGLWLERRNPAAYLMAFIIILSALVATVIGFGVEARLRLPVSPYLYMLAGVALARAYAWYENRFLHSRI